MPITTTNRRQLLRGEPRAIIGPGPRSAPPISRPAEPPPAIAKPKPVRRTPTPAEFERIVASAPPELANLLRGLWASDLSVGELRDMRTPGRPGEYVFPVPRRDGGQSTTDQIVKAISKLCAAAGVPATSSDISGGAARAVGSDNANVA
jgi:hypothetical protein